MHCMVDVYKVTCVPIIRQHFLCFPDSPLYNNAIKRPEWTSYTDINGLAMDSPFVRLAMLAVQLVSHHHMHPTCALRAILGVGQAPVTVRPKTVTCCGAPAPDPWPS